MQDNLPSLWAMVSVDIFLIVFAISGTIFVITKWKALKGARAILGVSLILLGLWTNASLYIGDLYTMTVLPAIVGTADAMAAMHQLHLKYSWFSNMGSATLILLGLAITILRLVSQLLVAREARVEADAANMAKSEFLATMSHELRTPLNAIIGFSEIMKEQTLGPVGNTKYLDYAGDIHGSGQHLLELINDILDLSKVESGMDELHEEEIEVSEAVHSAVRLVQQRAENLGVKLTSDTPGGLPKLRADKRKLKQILVNLLTNAIKFTEAGGKVKLRIRCDPESGCEFQIIDTGIGIAPEDVPKALSRFGQVGRNLEQAREGTGLGLPLTKALIEKHGGTLDLHSEIGKGTTVTLWFPAELIVLSDQEIIGSAKLARA